MESFLFVTSPVESAIDKYRDILFKMAAIEGDTSATRKWNRLVDQLRAERLVLQTSIQGRSAITELLDDARPTVRLWSAGHALFWEEAKARSVLEALRDAPSKYGLHSVSARYTLSEFDAGHLDPNWQPRGR